MVSGAEIGAVNPDYGMILDYGMIVVCPE